jgi:G2/mitotic-specific cyclin-B, other
MIGGAWALPIEIEVSESSCFGSVLESDLACPKKLIDKAEATEYSSAFDALMPVEPEDEVFSGPCLCDAYSLSPLLDLSPLTTDDDDDTAPSATFSIFLAFAK